MTMHEGNLQDKKYQHEIQLELQFVSAERKAACLELKQNV
jgi:hypothetical protein